MVDLTSKDSLRNKIAIGVSVVSIAVLALMVIVSLQQRRSIQWMASDGAHASPFPKIELVKRLNLGNLVSTVAWSPDGRYFATSEYGDKIVRIWDAKTWRQLHVIEKKTIGSGDMSFLNDGKTLVVSSTQLGDDFSALTLIDAPSGKIVRQVDGPNQIDGPHGWPMANQPQRYLLSADGSLLFLDALGKKGDGGIYVYETRDWVVLKHWKPDWGVTSMVAGRTPGELMTTDVHDMLQVWNVFEGRLVREFPVSPSIVRFLRFDNIRGLIFAGETGMTLWRRGVKDEFPSVERGVQIRNFKTGEKVSAIQANLPILGLDVSPDLFVVSDADRRIAMYRTSNMSKVAELQNFGPFARATRFSADGQFLAVAGGKKVLIFSVWVSHENGRD